MTEFNDPKIELHLHLEGGASPEFIRQIASEKNITIGSIFDENGNYKFDNFNDFLAVYEQATSVLVTPEDYYKLTVSVLANSSENDVIYTELFLSPDFCGGGELSAWKDYLAAIKEAAQFAERNYSIIAKGIVTCIRHYGPEKAKYAAICAAETEGEFIRGFGMAGAENIGKQGDFSYSFDIAREAYLHLTTHAGEWGGASSVNQAIFDLNVERIGHGVQVVKDKSVVQEIISRDITLEICPGSNIALSIYENFQSHPIADLRDMGVKVTVSTDDPPFFNTNMRKEYQMLNAAFGWGSEDFRVINENAINAAFCDLETKSKLYKKLEKK